jgi:hypothetical protein
MLSITLFVWRLRFLATFYRLLFTVNGSLTMKLTYICFVEIIQERKYILSLSLGLV